MMENVAITSIKMPGGAWVPCCRVRGFWGRLRGLLGTPSHGDDGSKGRVLLLDRCCSIHTFGMAYPIDVAFLDGRGAVVAVRRAMEVGRIFSCVKASCVLEREASADGWFEIGDAPLFR